jgi:hypothetical protein
VNRPEEEHGIEPKQPPVDDAMTGLDLAARVVFKLIRASMFMVHVSQSPESDA